MTNYSIPFTAEIGEWGITEANGLISYSAQKRLTIEFQINNRIASMFNSNVKIVELDWNEIEDFVVLKKWFKAEIIIRGNSLRKFSELPGAKSAEFKVVIKKENLKTAQNMRSELLLHVSEKKLELLENQNG